MGVHVTEHLSWTGHCITGQESTAASGLLLQTQNSPNPSSLCTFYRDILTSCITVWCTLCRWCAPRHAAKSCTALWGQLRRSSVYFSKGSHLTHKDLSIAGDLTHQSHIFFSLLSSGGRQQTLWATTASFTRLSGSSTQLNNVDSDFTNNWFWSRCCPKGHEQNDQLTWPLLKPAFHSSPSLMYTSWYVFLTSLVKTMAPCWSSKAEVSNGWGYLFLTVVIPVTLLRHWKSMHEQGILSFFPTKKEIWLLTWVRCFPWAWIVVSTTVTNFSGGGTGCVHIGLTLL